MCYSLHDLSHRGQERSFVFCFSFFREFGYYSYMNKYKTKQILGKNLRDLMKYRGYKSVRKMAAGKDCEVSDRMIGHILNQTASPTVTVVERLAEFFDVPIWALFVDGIDPADMVNDQLTTLITAYLLGSDEDRHLIAQTARNASIARVSEPRMPSVAHRYHGENDRRKAHRG